MTAKINKTKVGELSAKAMYTMLKANLEDNSLYAGVSYIPDSDWTSYAGLLDSEAVFYGGTDSEYGPDDNQYYQQTMYSMHKVFVGGVSRVIPRRDWMYGTVYDNFPAAESYVLVKEYLSGYAKLNVYQCLFSPRTPSTVAPTGNAQLPFALADNYIWKFMYSIENSAAIRFLNDKWMPVVEKIATSEYDNLTSDSVNYDQYISQINAEQGAVYGVTIDSDVLVQTRVTDSDFRVAMIGDTVDLIVRDVKNGSPSRYMKVKLNWDSESKSFNQLLTEYGQGYRGPLTVGLDSDSLSLNGISVEIAPGEGHGADVPTELKANNIMISSRTIPDETSRVVYGESKYNLVTLHSNPIDTQTGKIAQNEFYVGCNSFLSEGVNTFVSGDELKPYYNDDGRRGLVVSVDKNTVYYITTKYGTAFDQFYDSEVVSTVADQKITTIEKTYDRGVVFNSSDLLIADFKTPAVLRDEGQIETFNFVLTF